MLNLNKEFDELFQDIHKKLNNLLYKTIKEYGEKLYDEWNNECWYLDTLELRLYYNGEETKVIEYEYIVNEDDGNEPEWEEDSSGNFKRHIITTKNEYLEKVEEYIFEKLSLDKKIIILTAILE